VGSVRAAFTGGLVALAAALAARSARADEPIAGGPVPEVTVRQGAAGGFVSRQSIDDASREITDAASLVEAAPGVHVRRLGADDSFATLSIRGTSSTEVAVVLAGVPLTGGADPTLDLATLPLWPGASARVYRSFAPAALGRGSLGGTLALDPPSLRGPARSESWAAVGSFGALRLRVGDVRPVNVGGTDARVATALSASRADDDFTYTDFSTGRTLTRQNAGHADANGLVSFGMPMKVGDKEGAVTLTTLVQDRRQQLPGTIDAPTPHARLDSNRLVSAAELTLPASSGAAIARVWGRREGLHLSDDAIDAARATGPTHTDDAITALGASTGWRGRPMEPLLVDARVDGSSERFAPGTWQGPVTTPPGATRNQAGLALDAEYNLSPLRFAASGRLDGTVDDSSDAAARTAFTVVPTGHLGVEAALPHVTLAAHGGALSRPPSFTERYGDRGAFIGDPTLRPESATTVDAGGRIAWRAGPLRLFAELATFATWADDLIVFVPQGAYGRAKATNIGRARLLGLEADVRAWLAGAELRASYTGLATENQALCDAKSLTCERPSLPGRPSHDVVADLAYTIGPVRARYGVDFVSGIVTDLGGTIEAPARVLQSAGVRVRVPRVPELTVALDVRNLFDVRTGTYDGALGPIRAPIGDLFEYPLPGRSFLASVRFSAPASTPVEQ
jgi:hypothetical protein